MLACQKEAFSLPPDVHYFNCAYMSPFPRVVEEAGAEAIRRRRDPSHLFPRHFFSDSDRLRASFARLVGAPDPASIAIIPAVSYGIETVATNVDLGADRNIVVLHDQFPSNVYPWRRAIAERGGKMRVVDPPQSGEDRCSAWNDRILEAIDGETAVVAVPNIHWSDGTLFDLRRIGARAREVGAWFVIDGSQSVGALPIDVEELRPDALVSASYKWLFGPYGIGLAYFGERLREGRPLEATWLSREGSDEFSRLARYIETFRPGAARFDVGERSNFIHVAMLNASLELLLEWDPGRIQAYCGARMEPVVESARTMGYGVGPPDDHARHLIGIRAPDGDVAERLQEAFATHRVAASQRGDATRLSCHLFIDDVDVDALIVALEDARA